MGGFRRVSVARRVRGRGKGGERERGGRGGRGRDDGGAESDPE
jgi:hypothetical protein